MNRRELFDAWATDYRPEDEGAGFPFEGYERALAAGVRAAQVRPGDRVLELGTGTGALAAAFVAEGCRVTATDFSSAMLDKTNKALPGAEVVHLELKGDWAVLGNRRFDAVASSYVFHEFPWTGKLHLLRQAAARLAEHGRVVVADIAFETRAKLEAAKVAHQATWDDSEHYWIADEDMAAARAAGFRASFAPVSFCAGVFSFAEERKKK